MDKCVDCGDHVVRDMRCDDCLQEVAESPGWRRPIRQPVVRRAVSMQNSCAYASCSATFAAFAGRRYCSQRCRNATAKCTVSCAGGCGNLLWRTATSLPAGQATCRACRAAAKAEPNAEPNAVCAYCAKPYRSVKRSDGLWTATCSKACAQHNRRGDRPPGEDPIKRKASWRAKNHRRRAHRRAAFDQVTPQYECALRTKAKRCTLCRVRMTDVPYVPTSKELDHIVPLNVGGTHTIGNVRIICRTCNQARPRDGSDYVGPITLWSVT